MAKDYSDATVWGLIITARCDLAHQGKVNYVHYLPIVDYQDWLKIEMPVFCYMKALAKYSNCINKICMKYNIEYNLEILSYEDMEDIAKMAITKQQDLTSFLTNIQSIRKMKSEEFDVRTLSKSSIKDINIKLLKDEMSAYYLLEGWPSSPGPKVILLKELRRFSFEYFWKLKNKSRNITPTEYDDIIKQEQDFYKAEALIKSPIIEHILQRFTYNFCRVGVEDRDENMLNI